MFLKVYNLNNLIHHFILFFTFVQKYPERHIECFIAEQNMVGIAIGAACRDRTIAFVSTFATFFTRAFDQVCIYI